ncbi:MAG: efflux RND transporter periplasmic adaptor subunit [Desulfobacula sp.]|nr:efflux RND transporter periplasmic adaptor subunit [Desulfobacula sp.]
METNSTPSPTIAEQTIAEQTLAKPTQSKPSMTRKILRLAWKVIPFFTILLISMAIILPMFSMMETKKMALAQKLANEKAAPRALTNVITLEMIPGLLQEKLSLPGIAKPWVSLDVVAEVRGKIVDKKVWEGRYVKKGDILAVIDKSDYKNAYDSSLASHEIALANEKRIKALVKKNFVTRSQLDDTVAMVKTSKAALANAKLNLSRCTILSPMSGIIDRVHIENGTYLGSGDPVARILQIDKLKITVGIPESDVDAVRKLKTFDMTIDALGGKTYTGEYHYFYKTTDTLARLYNLEIKVDNTDGRILPDMFARVNIIKQNTPQGIAVPMYSLINQNNLVGVFVEKEKIAKFVPVETGFQDGWKIQISKGLSPGDKVVVVGHRIIEDGEKVNVTKSIRDMEELTK